MSELRLNTDGHIIKFGADNDVSLTHVADAGLLLNSTMKLQFNDASQYIQGASATVLDIAATDEIELTATTVDVVGAFDVTGTTTAVAITASGLVTANADMLIGGTTPTLTIGDAGAEDAKIVFDGNAQDFHIGLDDTDDSLKIGLGSALGTTAHIVMDATGAVTKPLQPAFLVVQTTGISAQSLTDGAVTTITFNSEVFDINADVDSNGVFTAPVTGKYLFCTKVGLDAGSSSNTRFDQIGGQIVASNRTVYVDASGTVYTDANDKGWSKGSCLIDMDASDTCHVALYVKRNGATTAAETTQDGGQSAFGTFFSGHLAC